MSLILAAAAVVVAQTCSWDQPGHNPYTGTPEAALAHYKDIPPAQRRVLAEKIVRGKTDDEVEITRNGISGKKRQYYPEIRDMHFGASQVCRNTTRAKWKLEHRESGAVYCTVDHCVMVPKVCGNISRVTPRPLGGGPLLGSLHPARGRLLPAPPPQTPIYDVSGPSGEEPGLAAPRYYPIDERYGRPVRAHDEHYTLGRFPGGIASLPVPGYPGPGRETISPIPEPASWSLLLYGFICLGLHPLKRFISRKQRRKHLFRSLRESR